MDRQNESVELFHAFEVEELETRLQHGYTVYYGDTYYGCCIGNND